MEYATTLKDDFLITVWRGLEHGAILLGALVSLHKDSYVDEHLGLTVQLWGLYGPSFSQVWGSFLAC
jgi:hypothetical protein